VTLVTLITVITSWLVLAPGETTSAAGSALAAAFYVSNMLFATRSADYLSGDLDHDPFLHTWSLGVEEQFYLLWPLLLVLVGRAAPDRVTLHRRTGVVFGVASAVSLCACVALTWTDRPWAFFGMPSRAWQFGLGALAWLMVSPGRSLPWRVQSAAGWLGAGLLAAAVATIDDHAMFPGWWATLPAVGAGLLILGGRTARPSWPSRALAWPLLVWLGDVSYSWYLWHWPALVFARILVGPDLVTAGMALIGALGLAHLTYVWLENPIRRARTLTERPRISLAGGIALSVTTGLACVLVLQAAHMEMRAQAQLAYSEAGSDDPPVYDDGCHGGFWAVGHPPCTYAARGSRGRIVLFGDSHAAHWFPALESLANDLGAELESLTKAACPSVQIPVHNALLRRHYDECGVWRNAMLERVVSSTPTLVVMSNGVEYSAATTSDPIPVSAEAWQAGLRRVLTRFHDGRIPVLVIHDTPKPSVNIPTCLARASRRGVGGEDCTFPPTTRRRLEFARVESEAVALERAGLFLDLTTAICPASPCEVERDGFVLFRDDNHLTATFSRSLAPLIRAGLEALATDVRYARLEALLDGECSGGAAC
jgi:peptidoglycan/LPS O-acetylase OafA/YrhL